MEKIKMKPWTDELKKKHVWLFNYIKIKYPDAELDTYIDKYKKYLMTLIEENPSWGDKSKESLLLMVSRFLHNNGNSRYSKIYQKRGIDFIKANNAKENENELDEKEEKYYRPHQYFVDILNATEYNLTNYEAHMKYLLLAIVTLQPTLRTSFYTSSTFIRTEKENDKKNNFIFITKRGKAKIYFIVNEDKVSKTKSYAIEKATLSKIQVVDDKLVDIILKSYETYPRQYLFEKNKTHISQNTFIQWLRDITNVDGITNDIMRSSYITWFYSQNPKYKDRENLSKQMRHSVNTASRNYNKVIESEEITKQNTAENLNELIVKLESQKNELENKLSVYIPPVKDEEDLKALKHYKKKRADILYNINKKNRVPREDTLKIYDIKFNKETNMYY